VFWRRIKCYGIGKLEYDALWLAQGGLCGICGCSLEDIKVDVDHDHVTNLVRGLLCHPCNFKLHVVEDSVFVVNAQRYLVKYMPHLV